MNLKDVLTGRNSLPNVSLTINIFGQRQALPKLYQANVNRKFVKDKKKRKYNIAKFFNKAKKEKKTFVNVNPAHIGGSP